MPASSRIQISDLYQGISSSQPPSRRPSGSVENLINGVCETTTGTSKRVGTIATAKIAFANNPTQTQISTINTTDFVVINVQGVRVFVDASKQVWAYDDAGNTVEVIDETETNFAYIQAGTLDDLDWAVAYDTAILVNRSVNVAINDIAAYDVALTVNVYSELPRSATNPMPPIEDGYYHVLLRENSDPAGYYQYVDGQYVRVSAPGDTDCRYDLTTMPHRFVYNSADNRVYYRNMPFRNRLSGNNKTNTVMPLEGKPILSVNYFQSRLVLLNDSHLCLSANSDIYQLFVNDIDNVAVTDRIVKDILINNLGLPLRTIVLGNSLLLACENGVLAFDAAAGTEALTNINGNLRKISDTKCQDTRLFTGNGTRVSIVDTNNMIHTFAIMDAQIGPTLFNTINNYDPRLLRNVTVRQIYMDSQEVYVLASTGDVYVHRSEISNGRFVQLAWSRFNVANRRVRWIDSWNNRVRFVLLPTAGYNNPYMTFATWQYETNTSVDAAGPASTIATTYSINLDSREFATGIYNSRTDETEFVHTYDFADIDRSAVVDHRNGTTHRPVRVAGHSAFFRGKIPTNGTTYLGFTYDFSMQLNNLWMGAQDVRLIGSMFSIFYLRTSDFVVRVGRQSGRQRTKRFSTNQYNNNRVFVDNTLAAPQANPTSTGVFKMMMIGDMRYNTVTIENNTAGNVTIHAIEYQLSPK